MAGSYKVVQGIEQVKQALLRLTPQLRRRAIGNALRAGGREVQKAGKLEIPELKKPIYRKGVLIRKPGTLLLAFKVRTSKDTARTGDVGVFVNIKPAVGADRGKYSPNDPFYWRWQNWGSKRNPATYFMEAGAKVLDGAAQKAFEKSIGPQIQRLNKPGATL
jgi:hypothetical protein